MDDPTVAQLAETLKRSSEEMLELLRSAGLPHEADDDVVSNEQKTQLLTFVQKQREQRQADAEAEASPRTRIAVARRRDTKLTTLRAGKGGRGSAVTVQTRRRAKVVVRTAQKPAAPGPMPAQASEQQPAVEPRAQPTPTAPASEQPVAAPTPTSAAEPAPTAPPEPAPPAPETPKAVDTTEAVETPEATAAAEASEKSTAAPVAPEVPKARGPARAKETPPRTAPKRPPRPAVTKVSAGSKPKKRAPTPEEVARATAEAAAKAQEAARAAASTSNRRAPARAGAAGRSGARDRGGRDEFRSGRDDRRREVSLKNESRRAKRRHLTVEKHGGEFEKPQEVVVREVEIGAMVTVGELAQRMSVKAGEVIKTLMGMGVMATINQSLDQDTAVLVVEEHGHNVKLVAEDEVEQVLEKSLQVDGERQPRPAVVTVMGHVDHGKTSLLDHIRNTRVVAGEAGGITQHIGAYHVRTEHGALTFIDTPGHAAFTAMRARGAKSTDVVILVVAADDGAMPQTEEAVRHARAAQVPIVVAVNKIDLEGADPERARNDLAALEVIPEEWGGDVQFVNVSAETGEGVDALLEAVVLQAELLELNAAPTAPAQGVVIESRLERGRGPVATLLVQNGTLKRGDMVIAGQFYGRARALANERGEAVAAAAPSIPVEMLGLGGTPDAGDQFSAVVDERQAREVASFRADRSQAQRQASQKAVSLESMLATLGQSAAAEKRVLKLVVKADVRGSLEAIVQACSEIGNDEVSVNVLGAGVGGITESDANMALTYGAAVFGFNTRADAAAKAIIEREGIDLRYYSVIYELLDDVRAVLEGMLAPEVREEIVGVAEVREVYRSPRYGQIAGCMVVEGAVARNKAIRVLRDNVVIFEGELESLRRFKEDVTDVRNGLECGIGVRNYNDVRAGDLIEVFESREVARALAPAANDNDASGVRAAAAGAAREARELAPEGVA